MFTHHVALGALIGDRLSMYEGALPTIIMLEFFRSGPVLDLLKKV